MAGRLIHFLVAGAAVFGGMVLQGDVDFDSDGGDHDEARVERSERGPAPTAERIAIRDADGKPVEGDEAIKRALAAAVAELVRAEGSLVAARFDDNVSDATIEQAEQRRDKADEAVDRLADELRAQSRRDRDSNPQQVRETIRDSVREAVGG